MKVAVAIIHGMGADKQGFSYPLQRGIAKAFTKLSLSHHWNDLIFQEILWADLLTPTQQQLFKRISAKYALRYHRLRRFFIEYLGDVIAYLHDNDLTKSDSFRRNIFSRFEASLQGFKTLPNFESQQPPLVIIGHSLGSVVLLDFLAHQIKAGNQDTLYQQLCGIVTLGSPLALWSLQDKSLGKPLPFPGEGLSSEQQRLAQWINIYDKDDVIAYPLKSINEHWGQAVTKDIAINVGGPLTSWNPLSHHGYWKNRHVHRQIAMLLATTLSK